MPSLYQRLTTPPAYFTGGVLANRAGLQVARFLYEAIRHGVRFQVRHPEFAEHAATLERDGIVVIPDFLPPAAWERVQGAYEEWGRSEHVHLARDKKSTGIDWVSGVLTDAEAKEGSFAAVLRELVAWNPLLIGLAETCMRRRVTEAPGLHYQQLSLTEGRADDSDVECVLHADRHFITVKAYLMMNQNAEENGAYVFCRGSHKLSSARLRTEYDLSIREAHKRAGKKDRIDPGLLERGRNVVTPRLFSEMHLKEEAITGKPNTLVVSNNRAYHRRGVISRGQRKQIRVIFHDLRMPWYAPLFRRFREAVKGEGNPEAAAQAM